MATESSWQPKWTENRPHSHYYVDATQARRPSAPTIMNQASSPAVDSHVQSWNERSRADVDHPQTRGLSSLTGPSTNASDYHSQAQERLATISSNSQGGQNITGPSQSLPHDPRAPHQRQMTDPPLTLHIPQPQDPKKTSPVLSAHPSEYQPSSRLQTPHQQIATSLPSFAAFQEHANRPDEPDEVEIAPMSARLPCSLCSKLQPMVREVAIAVAELDQNVQSYCNRSVTRTLDFPKDSPVQTVQWILDRVFRAKNDLQESARRAQPSYYYATPSTAYPTTISRDISPPNPLKRSMEQWDQDDLPAPKRRQSGGSYEGISGLALKDERRVSIDFNARSPPTAESAPGSAYPRISSPLLSSRPNRTLPSPSSIAYPPSAPPSLAPGTAPSMGSPGASYQPAVSIHTASASSATSAHIADLQHQVTLKSLSLQTLQGEYASLLQKLQREKVKTQTIEKKTTVADQEVNDLTSRTEELNEQVKSLETQLEESEKKRESDRADAAREKEQWGRMLEMGGRIHNKTASEKQRLEDENKSLSERVAAYEAENSIRFEQIKKKSNSPESAPSTGDSSRDVARLVQENALLTSRIEDLRSSLEEARRQSRLLDQRAREFFQHTEAIGTVVGRALDDEDSVTMTKQAESNAEPAIAPRPEQATPSNAPTAWSNPTPLSMSSPYHQVEQKTSPNVSTGTPSTSLENMASVARAVSPGPAELGFHVTPSTSSPEELVKALGPVPSTHHSGSFWMPPATPSSSSARSSNASRKSKKPSQKQTQGSTPSITAQNTAAQHPETSNFGSFRPLKGQAASPYPTYGPIAEAAQPSPYSQHISAGPESYGYAHGNSSPRARDEKVPISALMSEPAAHPQGYHEKGPGGNAVMPPPPRPDQSSPKVAAV